MKKQIDGWCAQNNYGDWMLCTCAYDRFHATSILHDQLDAEQEDEGWRIKPVRIIDASDDSKDVVVPRELLRFREKLQIELAVQSSGWARDMLDKLNEILPEKEDE